MGERSIIGLDLVRDTSEKVELIQKRLLMAQNQQKSYTDRRRQPLEFKVMPKKGVVRFGKGGS